MISSYVDFTGQMTQKETNERTMEAVSEELSRQRDHVKLLSSLTIAQYGDFVLDQHVTNGILGITYEIVAGNVATIPHNLGYTPQFMAYFVFPSVDTNNNPTSQFNKLPMTDVFTVSGGGTGQYEADKLSCSADSVNFYLDYENNTGGPHYYNTSGPPTMRYYIFNQPNT